MKEYLLHSSDIDGGKKRIFLKSKNGKDKNYYADMNKNKESQDGSFIKS